MQDSYEVPKWMTIKDSSLTVIPPNQLYPLHYKFILFVNDGFTTTSIQFTLNMTISVQYLYQLFKTYIGAVIAEIGYWVYGTKLRNIFCKKLYSHVSIDMGKIS